MCIVCFVRIVERRLVDSIKDIIHIPEILSEKMSILFIKLPVHFGNSLDSVFR